MKSLKNYLLLFALVFTFACGDDTETIIETVDSAMPTGTFTARKSGTFVAQNGTPTAGTVAIGTDTDGDNFLELGSNFTTKLSTGTVTIYLSTSQTLATDPGNNNPDLKLVGIVNANGQSYHKLGTSVESKFTHVIIWCGSANVPFGYAALQ